MAGSTSDDSRTAPSGRGDRGPTKAAGDDAVSLEAGTSALRGLGSHFAFGENWASYADLIDDERLAEAQRGLVRLLQSDGLRGRSFIDIGCGSGVHASAAARLGARSILAVDIDPQSVATTLGVLERYAGDAATDVRELSVFDLDPGTLGTFDVVHSWGVLHHTGAMHDAIRAATRMVAPGGVFAFALYGKTRLCGLWTREKRWYTKASPGAQRAARAMYTNLMRAGYALRGRDFNRHVADYKSQRGMDYQHDVHDWMGGYPYESIRPAEVEALMRGLGFEHVRSFARPYLVGWFGAGRDEYVYRRPSA